MNFKAIDDFMVKLTIEARRESDGRKIVLSKVSPGDLGMTDLMTLYMELIRTAQDPEPVDS